MNSQSKIELVLLVCAILTCIGLLSPYLIKDTEVRPKHQDAGIWYKERIYSKEDLVILEVLGVEDGHWMLQLLDGALDGALDPKNESCEEVVYEQHLRSLGISVDKKK
tara:strand:+ start:439 stop:762 length:324 start_codon:yes stop_codon:yes gene_type:complete